MYKIEMNPDLVGERMPDADFGVWVDTLEKTPVGGVTERDVHGFSSCWERGPGLPKRTTDLPHHLDDEIRRVAAECPARLLIGNDCVELLFHHVCGIDARANVENLVRWAEWCYTLVGTRFAVAPMFLGLVFDYAQDCRFMRWLAEYRVPMILFSGWRLLLDPKTLCERHASEVMGHDQFYDYKWHPHRYPYAELSAAIKATGVEVWTGVGYAEGLRAGTVAKAEAFGMKGVLTHRAQWEAGV